MRKKWVFVRTIIYGVNILYWWNFHISIQGIVSTLKEPPPPPPIPSQACLADRPHPVRVDAGEVEGCVPADVHSIHHFPALADDQANVVFRPGQARRRRCYYSLYLQQVLGYSTRRGSAASVAAASGYARVVVICNWNILLCSHFLRIVLVQYFHNPFSLISYHNQMFFSHRATIRVPLQPSKSGHQLWIWNRTDAPQPLVSRLTHLDWTHVRAGESVMLLHHHQPN